jgi:hypothetical protein
VHVVVLDAAQAMLVTAACTGLTEMQTFVLSSSHEDAVATFENAATPFRTATIAVTLSALEPADKSVDSATLTSTPLMTSTIELAEME